MFVFGYLQAIFMICVISAIDPCQRYCLRSFLPFSAIFVFMHSWFDLFSLIFFFLESW